MKDINTAPAGMTQLPNVKYQCNDNIDCDSSDLSRNTIEEILNKQSEDDSEVDPYTFLTSSFKELINIYRGNVDIEDLIEVKCYFSNLVARMEQRLYAKKRDSNTPVGSVISSNIPLSIRRKTHGNPSWKSA